MLLVIFSLVLFSGFALAQLSEFSDEFAKATQCLDNEIRTTQSLTLEEAVFSVLAGSSDSGVLNTITDEKDSNENCWPSGNCGIKETAQVVLAKQTRGENVDDALDWLKNQTSTPSDLIWDLQVTIDNNRAASCNVEYDGAGHRVTVNEDLTLTEGSPGLGSCLAIDNNNFWMRISSSCVDKEFNVGCDWSGEGSSGESFLSNLVYRKSIGGKVFVSSKTESSPNGGFHKQSISAKCFTTGGTCDYEGSLWATAALYNSHQETKDYVPYLLGLAENNQQFFPESFLMYLLGQGNNGDQFDAIIDKRRSGHWDITGGTGGSGGYSQFVDTGLAIIALGGGDSPHVSDSGTLSWLFSQTTEEGCFNNNNIRDTAFIIYAAEWRGGGGGGGSPLPPGGFGDGNEAGNESINNGGPNYLDDCELEGYYCGDSVGCVTGGGTKVDQYNCLSHAKTCCTIPVRLSTCGSLGGDICAFGEECSGSVDQAEDGNCCVSGSCRPTQDNEPEPTAPPDSPSDGDTGGGTNWWVWIIILVILIGLAVLGVIYRDKIRMWIFKRKGKVRTSSINTDGREFGAITGRRPPPRFGPPPGAMRGFGMPVRRPAGDSRDKEMEDTLKKLKEMSK